MFKDKVLLITGGTGSFGNAVLRRFLNSDIREVRIFSRDEKKQDDMRHELQNPKVKFYIGNVRDRQSVDGVMDGVDYIFHAAALKQVPSCEFFPLQAVQTNVLGTNNDRHRSCTGKERENHRLLYPVRQCDGIARFGNSAVGGADQGRQTDYDHRSEYDPFNDDPR